MKHILDEKTLIPIGFVGVIIGGVIWLTTLHVDVADASKDVAEIKAEQKTYNKDVRKIIKKLTRIETHLGIEEKETENE